VLGLAVDSGRIAYLFQDGEGVVGGAGVRQQGPLVEVQLPAVIQQGIARCPEVAVLATPAFLGRSQILPEQVAWGYLRSAAGRAPRRENVSRLVVQDVEIPSRFALPRLWSRHTRAEPGEALVNLSGFQATPTQVLRRLPEADLIELHVHGLLDPTVSDAPALVLASDERGEALLGSRDIEQVRLDRHPGVILGACDVGRSARYWSYAHSLPVAFMQSGASFVLASPAPIEDQAAGPFFEEIWTRIRSGSSVIAALRDERESARWRGAGNDWVRRVVAFY